jgi:hypothetical protein
VDSQLALLATKRDALQKGTSYPRRSRCTGKGSCKNVEAPDLATVKDFLRFCAAKGKGKIVEQITCDSLNSVAGWLFGGFTRVTDN